jgi:hypothetical protein
MKTRDLVCLYCLAHASSLRFDKKGRPYFTCGACGSRAFLVGLRDAVRSIALVQPLVAARVEEIEQDADARGRAATLEAQVANALRAHLRARPEAPAAEAAGGAVAAAVAR